MATIVSELFSQFISACFQVINATIVNHVAVTLIFNHNYIITSISQFILKGSYYGIVPRRYKRQ